MLLRKRLEILWVAPSSNVVQPPIDKDGAALAPDEVMTVLGLDDCAALAAACTVPPNHFVSTSTRGRKQAQGYAQ